MPLQPQNYLPDTTPNDQYGQTYQQPVGKYGDDKKQYQRKGRIASAIGGGLTGLAVAGPLGAIGGGLLGLSMGDKLGGAMYDTDQGMLDAQIAAQNADIERNNQAYLANFHALADPLIQADQQLPRNKHGIGLVPAINVPVHASIPALKQWAEQQNEQQKRVLEANKEYNSRVANAQAIKSSAAAAKQTLGELYGKSVPQGRMAPIDTLTNGYGLEPQTSTQGGVLAGGVLDNNDPQTLQEMVEATYSLPDNTQATAQLGLLNNYLTQLRGAREDNSQNAYRKTLGEQGQERIDIQRQNANTAAARAAAALKLAPLQEKLFIARIKFLEAKLGTERAIAQTMSEFAQDGGD